MKLENGVLVFEQSACWACSGKGKVLRDVSCPDIGKPMRGKHCLHCGTRSKYHRSTGTYTDDCAVCKGKGIIEENVHSVIPSEFLVFRIIRLNGQWRLFEFFNPPILKCYDEGKMYFLKDSEVIEAVRKTNPCITPNDTGGSVIVDIVLSRYFYSLRGVKK